MVTPLKPRDSLPIDNKIGTHRCHRTGNKQPCGGDMVIELGFEHRDPDRHTTVTPMRERRKESMPFNWYTLRCTRCGGYEHAFPLHYDTVAKLDICLEVERARQGGGARIAALGG